MKLKILLIVLFLPSIIVAQNMLLKGNIVEVKTGEPLPGATIIIKGTKEGTSSNFDGVFEISTKIGDTLVVSFLGMIPQEILVLSSPITIKMEDDIDQLNEVQISVGYFDVSKKDLSGSITQIGAEELEKNRVNSIESLLQGQAAGVVINESSEPGGGIGVSIRGVNSMLGGTQPLYVLDGVPVRPRLQMPREMVGQENAQSSLGFLNPNDIEKIEILKDAAATAIIWSQRSKWRGINHHKNSRQRTEGVDKISVNYDTSITTGQRIISTFLDGPGFERVL